MGTKAGSQRVSGDLLEPTKVGLVLLAEGFSPAVSAPPPNLRHFQINPDSPPQRAC
jgi:hypothetical protein